MGIQKSNLNERKITEILEKEYNITPKKITNINKGTANIFKIDTENERYILKEFIDKRTEESIIKETNIINFLKEKKLKVPEYVKTIKEKFYIKIEGRIVIVQKFIEGYTMENNTVSDYSKIIESATILGKMAKALKEYPDLEEENIIQKSFSKESIENGITKIEKLKKELKEDNIYRNEIEEDLNQKLKISKELEEKFDFNIIRKMTIINSHGDYSIQQLIYDNKETTVIDFETAKKLPIVWEVIRSYSYIDEYAKNGELNVNTLKEYFKEFSRYVKLNKYDLKYAAHIYLIQLVSSVYGYKEYNNDYTNKELLNFAFFRTKLCTYLYENLDKISKELSSIEEKSGY